MTVLHNIVLGGLAESFSTRFSSLYESPTAGYAPQTGFETSSDLLSCWAAYTNKSVRDVHYLSNGTAVAVGIDGLVATRTLDSSGVLGNWTDRTAALSTVTTPSGTIRAKVLKTLRVGTFGNYVVVACEKGKAAFTTTGTLWYPIDLNNSKYSVRWNLISATLNYIANGTNISTTSTYYNYRQFLLEIIDGQRPRGDLNGVTNASAAFVITSADVNLASQYYAGTAQPNDWAKTNISNYLIANYLTLSTELKSLVTSTADSRWSSKNTATITNSNDVVDIFYDGTVLTFIGRSGQVSRVILGNSTDPNTSYAYTDITFKDKKRLLGGNNVLIYETDNTVYSAEVTTDQGSPYLARVTLTNGGTTDNFSVGGATNITQLSSINGGSLGSGGNPPVILKILDTKNFILYKDNGTFDSGGATFTNTLGTKNYTILYDDTTRSHIYSTNEIIWKTIDNVNVFENPQETYSSVFSYSSMNFSQLPIKAKGIRKTKNSVNRRDALLYYTPVTKLGHFVSSEDFVNFHKSQLSNGQFISAPLFYTYFIGRNESNVLTVYLLTYHSDNTLNLTDISAGNTDLNTVVLDLSIPVSTDLTTKTVTSLSTLHRFSGGNTTMWIVIGLNTGELIQCNVLYEPSYTLSGSIYADGYY